MSQRPPIQRDSDRLGAAGRSATLLPAEAAPDPAPADVLQVVTAGELEVRGTLGYGGTSRVFLAHQRSLERDVAVKVLRPDARDRGVSLVTEARLTSRVEHPNVVPVYNLGLDTDGHPLLVMKNIQGASWLDLLSEPTHPLWHELAPHTTAADRLLLNLEILTFVCNAVIAAHKRGIIHRDIKPSNVMVAGPGEVYLVDWGIAFDRAAPPPPLLPSPDVPADSKPFVGTPGFMPPEMLAADTAAIDERSDVFMLGATLHYVLVGKARNVMPTGHDVAAASAALAQLAPFDYPPEVPDELALTANRACARDPRERFQSVAELRRALRQYLRHHESWALLDKGKERVDRLQLLLSAGLDPQASDALLASGIGPLIGEARAILGAALEIWPENVQAHAQLRRIEQHEADLQRELARIALVRERADGLARDMDLRTSASTRRKIFITLVAYSLTLGLAFVLLRATHGEDTGGLRAVAFSIVSTCCFTTVFFLARRQIFRNRVNRTIVGLMMSIVLFNLFHRIMAYYEHIDPRVTLTIDSLAVAMLASIAALVVTPRMWLVTAVALVCVLVSALAPATAQFLYAVSAFSMVFAAYRMWGRDDA